jgi:uncharacterized membrane protein YccC
VTLILTFVLAVAIEVPFEELGWRLVGWYAATAAATISALVLWPHRERSRLQRKAAGACRDLAGAIRAGSSASELERPARPDRARSGA